MFRVQQLENITAQLSTQRRWHIFLYSNFIVLQLRIFCCLTLCSLFISYHRSSHLKLLCPYSTRARSINKLSQHLQKAMLCWFFFFPNNFLYSITDTVQCFISCKQQLPICATLFSPYKITFTTYCYLSYSEIFEIIPCKTNYSSSLLMLVSISWSKITISAQLIVCSCLY